MSHMIDNTTQKEFRSIQDAITAFLDVAGRRSPQTRRSYETPLNRFLEFLRETMDLSPADDVSEIRLKQARNFSGWLAKYRNPNTEQKLSASSRMLYVLAVSLFYRRLILDKSIDDDWQDYVNYRDELNDKKPNVPIEKKLPPPRLVDAILAVVDQEPEIDEGMNAGDKQRARLIWLRNRAIIHSLYSSGMRVGELVKLKRADMRPNEQGVWVVGKGSNERFVRLDVRAWQTIGDYLEARDAGRTGNLAGLPLFAQHSRKVGNRILPISTRLVERIVSQAAEQTGLGDEFDMHPHSFRHYFATQFLRKTGDLALTQDALGHADPSTTRIYAEPSKEAYIKAHEELFNGR
jgi:integrase/recombinase XerD